MNIKLLLKSAGVAFIVVLGIVLITILSTLALYTFGPIFVGIFFILALFILLTVCLYISDDF